MISISPSARGGDDGAGIEAEDTVGDDVLSSTDANRGGWRANTSVCKLTICRRHV